MYKIILTNATNDNQKVVWDVKKDIKLLRSASMQKQEDGIDSVSISPVHNFVENSATFIQPYNTLIEIINEKTNVIEFKGRVLSPESEMTDSGLFTHELIFEGAEAYLKDSIQSYSFEFDKMPVENLKRVIAHHNNELKSEAYKHFKVGNVTVEKNIIPSDENYNEELKYFKRSDDKDTYETLMDLKEKYGGTFIFEPTNDVTLVHWLKETGNLTNTVIKIGKNLKSIQKKFDASEVITRLKPLGVSSETANGDEIKLTIAEVNNGSPYIDIPQLIKLFGIQTGTVTFDDKHTPETLKKAAEDWIKEHEKKQARISLSLDALDLSYLKLDPDEFKIYNKHRVICPPLNIDEDLKIISIKVDLLKPYDKEVSFGEREFGYAELEKERSIKNTNLIINKTVPGIIDRQTGGINRDVMVLNDYKITFEDLKLHQSNLLDEVNQILNSEYLVDAEVRADLLLKAQNVESLSNTIKEALESADERTINATKLVDIQNKMNAYRSALKSFVIAKEGAKISLLKRLQILQSQYTEKKFSDTLKSVAEKFGLTVNQYNELIGEPNVVQKAISVVTEQTDSKLANYVKSQDYQTDKNGIVERLNNSDSERQQLSNQIADRVTITEYNNGIEAIEQNTDQKLSTMKTETLQDGKKISQEVSQQVFNTSSKTLNQTLSQYINSISTGHQFTYDENGNITSFTVGSSGIKLNARVIDMNDGDVTIKNGVTTITDAYIPKLFSKQATIEYLDAIGITARTLQARDKLSTVNIEKGSMTFLKTDGNKLDLNNDGLKSYNPDGSLRFRLDTTFVMSSALGTKNENVYLASFREVRAVHYNSIPGDGNVRSYQYTPVRASQFYGNRLSVNHGIDNVSNLYLSPLVDGEVRVTHFDTVDIYRPLRALEVFASRLSVNQSIEGNTNLYLSPASNGEVVVSATNSTDNYRTIRARSITLHGGDAIRSNVAGNMYIGVGGYELLVTNNNFGNDGNPSYRPVRALAFNNGSYVGYKKDIVHWDYDALSVIKKDLDIMQYRLKDDETKRLRRGVIVGGESKTPVEFINNDGVDLYEMVSWALRSVQQLAYENDERKNEDEILKNMMSGIEDRLKILEDKLNESTTT